MSLEEVDALLDAADAAYTRAQTEANDRKSDLFDAMATAVRAGRTPTQIEARLKAGKTLDQIKNMTFTAAYIRRKLRERGVAAVPPGPRPNTTPAGTERIPARVLLTVGDTAELVTGDHDRSNPLRVPAADIASDIGIPANELPGKELTALRGRDGTLSLFELVDDPRL